MMARQLFSFLLMASLLSSCCAGRRPPIMHWKEDCVIDYAPCFAGSEWMFEQTLPDAVPVDEAMLNESPESLGDQYKLSPGDRFEMQVFGDPETLLDEVLVAPDGKLYYGFVEGVDAEGKSVSEVRSEVETQLEELYIEPKVAMNLVEAVSQTYHIIGRVKKPGRYPVFGAIRLREAIAQAGGLLREQFTQKTDNAGLYPLANLEKSFLQRGELKIKPDFKKLLFSCDNSQNLYVYPGDFIYISPQEALGVFILGAAADPKRIAYEQDMTLTRALAEAGGWVEDFTEGKMANLSKALLIRGELECPYVAEVNILKILKGQAKDIYLMPGDILYLQNKKFRLGRELVRIAIRTIVQAFGITAGNYYGLKWFPVSTGSSGTE